MDGTKIGKGSGFPTITSMDTAEQTCKVDDSSLLLSILKRGNELMILNWHLMYWFTLDKYGQIGRLPRTYQLCIGIPYSIYGDWMQDCLPAVAIKGCGHEHVYFQKVCWVGFTYFMRQKTVNASLVSWSSPTSLYISLFPCWGCKRCMALSSYNVISFETDQLTAWFWIICIIMFAFQTTWICATSWQS